MFGFKAWRRRRYFKQDLPERWNKILHENVPYVKRLPDKLQEKLSGLVNVFIKEKSFEGCAGLKITDEVRVSIATQASILLLGLDDLSTFYDNVGAVLVYPKPYIAKIKSRNNSFFVQEGFQQRRGEAWPHGNVVLAWDEVQKGALDIHDGHNLVFHEFAHQLDYEYDATKQVEEYSQESHYLSWARVLGEEYHQFVQSLRNNQPTLIRKYEATNLAECFAVVTEIFVEQHQELQEKHPDLYSQLKDFYQQDPASYLRQ